MYRIIDVEQLDLQEIQAQIQLRQLNSDRLGNLHYRTSKADEFIEVVRTTLERCSTLWDCTQGRNQRLLFLPGALSAESEEKPPIGCVEGDDLLLDYDYFYEKIKRLSAKDVRFRHKSKRAYFWELFLAGVLKRHKALLYRPWGRLALPGEPRRKYFCVDGDLFGIDAYNVGSWFAETQL